MVKRSCSSDLKKHFGEFDQNAETLVEMLKNNPELGMGVIRRLAKEKVETGEWEKVWKRVKGGHGIVPAYRIRA